MMVRQQRGPRACSVSFEVRRTITRDRISGMLSPRNQGAVGASSARWRCSGVATSRWTALLALGLLTSGGAAQGQVAEGITPSGDFRAGYFHLDRVDQNGATSTSEDLRARLRIGAAANLSEVVGVKVRVAGRLSTEQEGLQFYLHGYAPTTDGLRVGQTTVDEAYVNVGPSHRWNLRVGRLQTRFTLADLLGKSLDRGDSPNTEINWTDGAHLAVAAPGGWRSHLVLQHNPAQGPSNVVRSPLVFSDRGSRITVFTALENVTPLGPVVQRGVDLTWIPAALDTDGSSTSPENYLAVVARGLLTWPIGHAETRLSLGGEAGFAPNTPTRESLRLGEAGDGDSGGTAYQVAVTLAEFVPRHRVGLVYGQAEAGWLIAPDFRPNDRLLEGRYQWALSARHSFEGRLRWRQDLEQVTSAPGRRQDVDFYLRISSRF